MNKEMKRILKNIDLKIKNLDNPTLNKRVEMKKESKRILECKIMLENIDLKIKNLEYRIQKLENLNCKHFTG